jgi:hypothetical protein
MLASGVSVGCASHAGLLAANSQLCCKHPERIRNCRDPARISLPAYGRRWVTRADALAEAAEKRLELEQASPFPTEKFGPFLERFSGRSRKYAETSCRGAWTGRSVRVSEEQHRHCVPQPGAADWLVHQRFVFPQRLFFFEELVAVTGKVEHSHVRVHLLPEMPSEFVTTHLRHQEVNDEQVKRTTLRFH